MSQDETPTVLPLRLPPKPREFTHTLQRAVVRIQDEPERNSTLTGHRAVRVYINNRAVEGLRLEGDLSASLFLGTVTITTGGEDVPKDLLSRDLRVLRIHNETQRTSVIVSVLNLNVLGLALNDR